MKRDEVMDALREKGTEQNRKTYARHGVGGECYGVSYADLYALQKRLKGDHDLALGLWDSGNHDARILATLIADPALLSEAQADAWIGEVANFVQADAAAAVIAKTPYAAATMRGLIDSGDEWRARIGWVLLNAMARSDEAYPDDLFLPYLAVIEAEIHGRENRVREAMNGCLIAIGGRGDALQERALAVAAAVGKVHVDHGPTACKTPDAAAYIPKTRAHRRAKEDKAARVKAAR
ncbi:MAG TPA: DNA alkylation repair protein [Armatimonadaceae bacterium]|nr:DNA alkylation repair protein [Armatimonadaceae bacterium]